MTITKNTWKVAAFLLILCMVSAVMISGTYAKYTSTYAGQDTALVAKWNIVATGGGIGMADGTTAHLNLFSHNYKTNLTASSGSVYIMAPGVDGNFTLQFQNNSDVAASINFTIAKNAGSANVPVEYSTSAAFTATTTEGGLQTALNADSTLQNVAVGANVSKTIYWRWNFTGNDAGDTALGVTSAAVNRSQYGLTITASAVQLTPAP